MSKSLVLLSGGVDSTVVLYSLLRIHNVETFSIDYGQRHVKELKYAKSLCEVLNVPHTIYNLGSTLTGSSLTSKESVPSPVDVQTSTVVPNRNMVMLSLATSYAIVNSFDYVYIGCNLGDSHVYPDCRNDFLFSLRKSILLSTENKIELRYPLIGMSKQEVIEYGKRLKVPFDKTWSCYNGLSEPCNNCFPCKQRQDYGIP